MKQRVAVALATVWLASIVGASVPSGETTAFSTHRPPGPSPDQYTPLLRNPRYYSQDDYGQDWMNDEPSRIKVANRPEDLGRRPITNSDVSIPFDSASNEFYSGKIVKGVEDVAVPNSFTSKGMKGQSDLDKEAMRLSSIKVAFDEPIDSEISEDSSEEDWMMDGNGEEGEMQQDEFISDGTFEDEGPGSVEVYKLDLYKDRSVLSPKPRKSWSKGKSKTPKKVEAVDQISRKSKDQEDAKQKTVPRAESRDEFSPSRSLKDRIFATGGVPELQVGCEGVEGPQRQKRSNSEEPDRTPDASPARGAQLYIDDYDEDEDEDEGSMGITDELLRILSQATTTTESPSVKEDRGDMDPRIKMPGDLGKKKDKLPIRGDLGTSGDPNLTDGVKPRQDSSAGEAVPQVGHRRKLMSFEEEEEEEEGLVESFRNKRSSDRGQAQTYNAINGDDRRGRRGHRGARRHGEGKRRRRHEGSQGHDRRENEIRRRNKRIDENGEDYGKMGEDDVRENRLVSDRRSHHRSNSLDKESMQKYTHSRVHKQQMGLEKRSDKERRTADENERKLEDYRRRNTPIPRGQRTEDNHQRRQPQRVQLPTPNSKNEPPQNIRLPSPPVYGNERIDRYAENRRRRLQEQRQQEVGRINRAEYEQKLGKLPKEQLPQSTERPQNQREGKNREVYKPRSQQEIDRLNALPVSAYILINQPKTGSGGQKIEGRFGGDDIVFPGLTPGSDGRQVPNFPSPATSSPPVAGPSPCTWAVMTCCSNPTRLATCFEAKGCYQGHWDNPCTQDKIFAALQMVNKYYGG